MTLLRSLAGIYGVVLGLTRESSEVEVRAAYKKVSRRAHPDRGGTPEHQTALNAARGAWEEALRGKTRHGGDHTMKRPAGNISGGDENSVSQMLNIIFDQKLLKKIPLRRYKRSSIFQSVLRADHENKRQLKTNTASTHMLVRTCVKPYDFRVSVTSTMFAL